MTIHISNHVIAKTADGKYLSYYQSCWYIGKYDSLAIAKMALDEARAGNIKGVYAQLGNPSPQHSGINRTGAENNENLR